MKFEYKIIDAPTLTTINLLGKDEWELVSVVSQPPIGILKAFFKRELSEKRKKDIMPELLLEDETPKKETKKSTKSKKS